jgi:hypothetical protein
MCHHSEYFNSIFQSLNPSNLQILISDSEKSKDSEISLNVIKYCGYEL